MTSVPRACSLAYCDRPSRKRTLCTRHYDQTRRGTLVVEGITFPPCSQEACTRPRYNSNGLCHSHHYKAKGQTPEGKADRDRRNREWHSLNSERVSERKRAERAANPEKLRDRYRTYYANNMEKVRERSRIKYHSNIQDERQKSLKRSSKRRALLLGSFVDSFTAQDILSLYGSDCNICGKDIDLNAPRQAGSGDGWEQGLHIDHVIPLSKGGTHSLDNCRPSHALCNIRKGNRQ